MILALLVTLAVAGADSTDHYYLRNDVEALQSWCATVQTRAVARDRFHCLYRLFPLTRDEDLIRDIPSSLDSDDARAYAFLSGLWGYRASTAGVVNAIRYGMRAQKLLDRALEMDPDDPFVILVDGNSLLFKPHVAGGDRRLAALRFADLAERMRATPDPEILPEEAFTWEWVALARDDDPRAPHARDILLQQDIPSLLRLMLNGDP